MEAKHTPGPWRCACDSYGKVRHSKKKCVYTTITRPGGDELVNIAARIPNWGDAYLIAAAPDLLAALEYVYLMLGDFTPDGLKGLGLDVALEKVDAAIIKTTGAPC